MKYTLIITIILFILSCSEKEDIFIPVKFEIEKLDVKMPREVRDIIQFQNEYIFYSMSDTNYTIGVLNKDFTFNEEKSKLLNIGEYQWYSSIWSSNDTLFAIIGGWPGYSKVFWKNNKWTTIKSGNLTRETYMSTELEVPIYEDNEFIVHTCCRGEFGGAIFFKEKETGKSFSCRATCLNGIQKFKGSFYITSSLPHGSGFARVIKIDNPRNLYEIKNKSQLQDCGWYDIYPKDPRDEVTHPKGYDKGYEVLLDTMDIHIVGAFLHDKHIYQIFSDDRNTYLGYIKNKKLIATDTIIDKVAWHGQVRDLKHNSNIFPIRSRDLSGVIILNGKKIKLVEFI